jgi:hypothetical protein
VKQLLVEGVKQNGKRVSVLPATIFAIEEGAAPGVASIVRFHDTDADPLELITLYEDLIKQWQHCLLWAR